MSVKLKAFRSYDEHDVVNGLYSTVEGDLAAGTLLEYVSADPDNQNGFGDSLSNVPNYAYSADYVVNWKVQAAQSGSKTVAGLLLKTVVSTITDPWSMDARFADQAKLSENQYVVSGRAVPFATRGIFEISGLDTGAGIPGAGSGLFPSNSGSGILAVGDPSSVTNRVGTVLSSQGTNGNAVIKLNIRG